MTGCGLKSVHAIAFQFVGAAVAFFLAVSAFGADETDATVAKPQVKVGDRWTYRRTDYLTNKVRFTYENRVASTGPDEILVVTRRRNSSGESDDFFTSEWNPIALGGTTLIPRAGFFKFPLKVGASHESTYETAIKNSQARSRFELTVKVMGWEDITVPAGRFRALKLEANGTFLRLDQRFGGWVQIGFWYVPEIKRWVKTTYSDGTRGPTSPYETIGDELVEFKVQ